MVIFLFLNYDDGLYEIEDMHNCVGKRFNFLITILNIIIFKFSLRLTCLLLSYSMNNLDLLRKEIKKKSNIQIIMVSTL